MTNFIIETDKTKTYTEILDGVEIGDYIQLPKSGEWVQKTGWRSSRAIDFRHIDHYPELGEFCKANELPYDAKTRAEFIQNKRLIEARAEFASQQADHKSRVSSWRKLEDESRARRRQRKVIK